jgi:hypothetical protein
LEHADGVGLLQGLENLGIVLRQVRDIDLGNQFEAIFDHRHHAQAEQVHLDDAHIGAVFLVPLHHHAAGHAGRFERDHGIELPLADDHAAGMLAQVARQI